MSIGVALVGSGIFVKEQHLPAILSTPDLSLKAVYSRSLASAAALTENLAQKIDWYSDETASAGRGFDDMLLQPNIKAVIIALPIMAQPAYIRKALEAGKHVLSEKPIAPDVATATQLIDWYTTSKAASRVTWGVAENFRFVPAHVHAAEQVKRLGRVLGFRVNVASMVQPGNKYMETPWRKQPEYQGGFLLDGGVHFVAATRLLLGSDNVIARISAFTALLQPHLAPIDTVNAVLRTRANMAGTMSISFGTTFKGSGFAVACEHGTVTVLHGKVTVQKDGVEATQEFDTAGDGVPQEIKAWSESLTSGFQNQSQMPEEALEDLKILEAMLQSGEHNANPIDIGR